MPRVKSAAWIRSASLLMALVIASPVMANEVEIVQTRFEKYGSTWTVDTTLLHNDTGWDHYADKWRVVDSHGKLLGERVLFHPHENEQPFTRSESGIEIPDTTKKGERFSVIRK